MAATAAPRVETVTVLAEGPANFEGIDQAKDGGFALTSNFDNRIYKFDAAGKPTGHVDLPLHPQVDLLTPDGGLVVTGHERLPDFAARKPGQGLSLAGLGTGLMVVDRRAR